MLEDERLSHGLVNMEAQHSFHQTVLSLESWELLRLHFAIDYFCACNFFTLPFEIDAFTWIRGFVGHFIFSK